MRKALEKALGLEVEVPINYDVMGAFGAAVLAKERLQATGDKTRFGGFAVAKSRTVSAGGEDCPNNCEIVQIRRDGRPLACWGSRCGKHQVSSDSA